MKIDDLSLDQETMDQPTLYMKYAELANEASQEYSDTKDYYSVRKAEIEMEIRTGVRDTGLNKAKPTEGDIKSCIESDPELHALKKEVNQKKRDYDDLNSAVSAFDSRKHSIANVIKLIDMGYKSDPYQSKGHDEHAESRAKNKNN